MTQNEPTKKNKYVITPQTLRHEGHFSDDFLPIPFTSGFKYINEKNIKMSIPASTEAVTGNSGLHVHGIVLMMYCPTGSTLSSVWDERSGGVGGT